MFAATSAKALGAMDSLKTSIKAGKKRFKKKT
jgi:hypothetical protein